MDLRQSRRFSVQCPIAFYGDHIEGEGTVLNLSMGGWKIETDQRVPKGQYLTLRVYLPGQDDPVSVDLAAVRWSYGRECGLEFIRMRPMEQDRLRQFIDTLPPSSYVPPSSSLGGAPGTAKESGSFPAWVTHPELSCP